MIPGNPVWNGMCERLEKNPWTVSFKRAFSTFIETVTVVRHVL